MYQIDVQDKIYVQVGKFLKKYIKRAGQNRGAGGKFSGKSINMQRENLQFFHQQTGVSIFFYSNSTKKMTILLNGPIN